MFKSPFRPIGVLSVPDALNAYRSPDLISNQLTQQVTLDINATMTIAVAAATGVLNGGSILGAVEEIQFIDNGEIAVRFTGMELLAFNEHLQGPSLGAVRLTALAAAAYPLREIVRIPFAWPWPSSLVPTETGYRQRSGNTKMQVAIKMRAMDGNNLIVIPGAGGTAAITAVTAQIVQESDASGILPVAIPEVLASQVQPVAGAVAGLRIPLDTPNTIRAILLYGSTANRGDVADVITNVKLVSDQGQAFGPNSIPFATLVQMLASDGDSSLGGLGGFAATPAALVGGVYALIDFQRLGSGRLSNLLGKGFGTNLRIEVDAAPSAVAGATGSGVRALMYTLKRVPGITSEAGAALLTA